MNMKNFLILINVIAGCNVAYWGYVNDSPLVTLVCGSCSGINFAMALALFMKDRT